MDFTFQRKHALIGAALFFILTVVMSGMLLYFEKEADTSLQVSTENIYTSPNTISVAPTLTSIPTPTTIPLPQSKVLSGGSHTFQSFNNCGPSALSMALSYFGITESQSTIGRSLRPYQNAAGDNDDKSVTLAELAQKGEEYGFIAFHRPAGDEDIVKAFIAQDIPVITRTWLKVGDDIGHYRVIKGYDDATNSFIQDDSLQGANLWYTYQDFDALWHDFNYEFLVLVPKEKELLARGILGNLQDENEAWQQALKMSEQEIAQNPSNTYAQFNKSVALYHLGRYEESIQVYESIQTQLSFRTLWYQIEPIQSYFKAGKYEEVISISDAILNNHNRAFSELHYLKGESYRALGNESAAQQSFRLATQYNNTSEIWKVNLR